MIPGFLLFQLTDFRHYLYWQNRGWGTPVGKYFDLAFEHPTDLNYLVV